jgi:hypothetical protein
MKPDRVDNYTLLYYHECEEKSSTNIGQTLNANSNILSSHAATKQTKGSSAYSHVTRIISKADLSTKDVLRLPATADCPKSPNLNTLSITDSSVLVVVRPQKAIQSFTTIPPPITSLP